MLKFKKTNHFMKKGVKIGASANRKAAIHFVALKKRKRTKGVTNMRRTHLH